LADLAHAEFAVREPLEGLVDEQELLPLAVRQAEEELLRVGGLGLVHQVLGDVGLHFLAFGDGLGELAGDALLLRGEQLPEFSPFLLVHLLGHGRSLHLA
jgi:hypothetical protein